MMSSFMIHVLNFNIFPRFLFINTPCKHCLVPLVPAAIPDGEKVPSIGTSTRSFTLYMVGGRIKFFRHDKLLFWPLTSVSFLERSCHYRSSSLLCHQTFRFHCYVHVYPISLNLRRSSNVHGCVKREHRNICAVFSSSSPHAHVVPPLK